MMIRARSTTQDLERGSTTLENIIAYPAVLLLIFGIFQASMYYHAQNVAHGAATVAFHSARVYQGSADQGRAQAQAVLARSDSLQGASVTVSRTATTTRVTVTGNGSFVVPGFPWSRIKETITGPTERYVP